MTFLAAVLADSSHIHPHARAAVLLLLSFASHPRMQEQNQKHVHTQALYSSVLWQGASFR